MSAMLVSGRGITASQMTVSAICSTTGCTGMMPLADAICDAVNDFPGGSDHRREMHVGTDGEENNSSGPCSGPDSQSKTLRMTLVYDNTRHGAHAQVTLNLT
jgi:hypothetical protein